MTTNRSTTRFRCKRCKKSGEVTVHETDHPYNTETWVDSVTDGFKVSNPIFPSATVHCETCGSKVHPMD
jgi:DNA-directed RNA polymerase subunit RPC12/RpoP